MHFVLIHTCIVCVYSDSCFTGSIHEVSSVMIINTSVCQLASCDLSCTALLSVSSVACLLDWWLQNGLETDTLAVGLNGLQNVLIYFLLVDGVWICTSYI